MLPSGFRHSDARRGGVGAGAGGKTAAGTPNYRRLRSTLVPLSHVSWTNVKVGQIRRAMLQRATAVMSCQ